MKKKISNITLPILALSLGTVVSVGIYETAFSFPKYFANPPISFQLLEDNISITAPAFWIPIQGTTFGLLIINTLLNWQSKRIRYLLLVACTCYLIVTILSVLFFVPQINEFLAIPEGTPPTPELLRRASDWLNYSWIRQFLLLLGELAVLVSLTQLNRTETVKL